MRSAKIPIKSIPQKGSPPDHCLRTGPIRLKRTRMILGKKRHSLTAIPSYDPKKNPYLRKFNPPVELFSILKGLYIRNKKIWGRITIVRILDIKRKFSRFWFPIPVYAYVLCTESKDISSELRHNYLVIRTAIPDEKEKGKKVPRVTHMYSPTEPQDQLLRSFRNLGIHDTEEGRVLMQIIEGKHPSQIKPEVKPKKKLWWRRNSKSKTVKTPGYYWRDPKDLQEAYNQATSRKEGINILRELYKANLERGRKDQAQAVARFMKMKFGIDPRLEKDNPT